MRDRPKAEWPYFVQVPAAVLAIPLSEMKTWLKITHSDLDAEITALIEGATKTAEHMTRLDLIDKTYRTFRDVFSDSPLCFANYAALVPSCSRSSLSSMELRKSRLRSVEAVEYLKSGSWETVSSSVYYNTVEVAYSKIMQADGESWPTDLDKRAQAVRVDFIAGYGDSSDDIPPDIRTAIKMHVANAFANRGDCMNAAFLPEASRLTYGSNRIMEIGT